MRRVGWKACFWGVTLGACLAFWYEVIVTVGGLF